jgi:hypothetical protein
VVEAERVVVDAAVIPQDKHARAGRRWTIVRARVSDNGARIAALDSIVAVAEAVTEADGGVAADVDAVGGVGLAVATGDDPTEVGIDAHLVERARAIDHP